MKKHLITSIPFFAVFVLLLFGCKPDQQVEGVLPGVSGKPGEILVVMDTSKFNHEEGLAMKKKLQEAHKALPQAEPMFDLINIPGHAFKNVFRRYRNILIVNIDSKYSKPRFAVRKNVYAKPQTIIHAQAPNDSSLRELFNQKGEVAVEKFLDAERSRYINTYKDISNAEAMDHLTKKFGIDLVIPKGYAVKLDTTNFSWISQETPDYTQGIFVYKRPYKENHSFTVANLVNTRNTFTEKYVPGPSLDSYMIVEELLTPYLNRQVINGNEVAIMRGLWKVKNDFMGGPFVSMSILTKDKKQVITADGFVYAPRFDKRDYVRQIESILYTLDRAQ